MKCIITITQYYVCLQLGCAFFAGIGSYFLPNHIAGLPLTICRLLYEMRRGSGTQSGRTNAPELIGKLSFDRDLPFVLNRWGEPISGLMQLLLRFLLPILTSTTQ